MNEWHLQQMYQQWIQENEAYAKRWLEFVRMAAHFNNLSLEEMQKKLEYYSWFKKD
jgi:hypothetical protein